MEDIIKYAPQKSFYPIYSSEIFDPFVRGLKHMGATATDIAGKLRSFGNNSMATYIETNEIAQQMLGLTHSGGGGGTDGATTGGTP